MMVMQQAQDYSQNGEQWAILDALAKSGTFKNDVHNEPPRFLDLGAFDGLTGSNTRALSDQGWRGVLVEADPRVFTRLVSNHSGNEKMRCVLGAVVGNPHQGQRAQVGHQKGAQHRIRQFYDAGDQVSTIFSGHRIQEHIRSPGWWVASLTPGDIAQVFGSRFEFISVDVEGQDLDVIEWLKPVLTHTRVVCFEDTLPGTEWDMEYYERLRRAWAAHGFGEVVARTVDKATQRPCNTIVARGGVERAPARPKAEKKGVAK